MSHCFTQHQVWKARSTGTFFLCHFDTWKAMKIFFANFNSITRCQDTQLSFFFQIRSSRWVASVIYIYLYFIYVFIYVTHEYMNCTSLGSVLLRMSSWYPVGIPWIQVFRLLSFASVVQPISRPSRCPLRTCLTRLSLTHHQTVELWWYYSRHNIQHSVSILSYDCHMCSAWTCSHASLVKSVPLCTKVQIMILLLDCPAC